MWSCVAVDLQAGLALVIAILSHFRQISFLTTKSKVRQWRHHCGMHFIQFRCSKCSNKVFTRSFMLQTGSSQSHFASINVAVCLYIFQSLTGLVVKKAAFGHTFFCYLEPVKGGTLVLLIKKSVCWMHPTPQNRGLSFELPFLGHEVFYVHFALIPGKLLFCLVQELFQMSMCTCWKHCDKVSESSCKITDCSSNSNPSMKLQDIRHAIVCRIMCICREITYM